jgi:hypothetical protein
VASVEFFFLTKCAAQAEAGDNTLEQPISVTLDGREPVGEFEHSLDVDAASRGQLIRVCRIA